MNLRVKSVILVIALCGVSVANADLIWSIDLKEPQGTVRPSRTLVITGTLFNSLSSTENLGVIGGLLGEPAGFDYEVGAFASSPREYSSSWATAGADSWSEQFEGVDLAPGESFDFEFRKFSPTALVVPGTYMTWLQLQLFKFSAERPRIGTSFDSVSWTVTVSEPGTLALFGIGLAGMGLARRTQKRRSWIGP